MWEYKTGNSWSRNDHKYAILVHVYSNPGSYRKFYFNLGVNNVNFPHIHVTPLPL